MAIQAQPGKSGDLVKMVKPPVHAHPAGRPPLDPCRPSSLIWYPPTSACTHTRARAPSGSMVWRLRRGIECMWSCAVPSRPTTGCQLDSIHGMKCIDGAVQDSGFLMVCVEEHNE